MGVATGHHHLTPDLPSRAPPSHFLTSLSSVAISSAVKVRSFEQIFLHEHIKSRFFCETTPPPLPMVSPVFILAIVAVTSVACVAVAYCAVEGKIAPNSTLRLRRSFFRQ